MQDILKMRFPYNHPNYDDYFINRKVIHAIRSFCEENDIRAFYAKGSIIHGCMVKGSDVDHVRIRTIYSLNLNDKIILVDKLESILIPLGVSELKRIREDGYVRVFSEWKEIEHLPKACTDKFELYPDLKIFTGKNKVDWFRNILHKAALYIPLLPPSWVINMKNRINSWDTM